MKTKILFKKTVAVLSIMSLFAISIPSAFAESSTVQTVLTAGTLTIPVIDATTTLTAQNVTTAETTSTGTTSIEVLNNRGDAIAYSVTATVQHLTAAIAGVRVSGSGTGTVAVNTSTTDYNGTLNPDVASGDPKCFYELTFSSATAFSAGIGPTTEADCTNNDTANTTGLATGTNVAIGSRDLRLNFTGTFGSNDIIRVVVDKFNIASAQLSAISAITGLLGGNTTGSTVGPTGVWVAATTTSSVSNARTLLSFTAGHGFGRFSQNMTHSWLLHRNPLAATYTALLTLTAA